MLPHSDDLPSGIHQRGVDLAVPLHVPAELRDPVVAVRLGHDLVLGAAVPEAAVKEHGDADKADRGCASSLWCSSGTYRASSRPTTSSMVGQGGPA